MCDTFVATPDFTAGGSMLLAKNSDREPNEAQALVRCARQAHAASTLRVTYREIPQVRETHEVILSKPFQMWGAEMGVNEHGLAIGNEAVFTKLPFKKDNSGLTGMDLLRLALERAGDAEGALEVITTLLEEYGQDACGGYTDRGFFYHNSFLIADPRQAFVLETADRRWAAARVTGFRSISNGLTIEQDFDFSSRDCIDFAHKQGWIKKGEDFSFRRAYSDRFMTHFSKCLARRTISTARGQAVRGRLDAGGAMDILRDHGAHDAGEFFPARSDMATLCVHAAGLFTPSQTTGSMVAELRSGRPGTYWFTGTAAPCLSVFKPLFIPGRVALPEDFAQPGARPDGSLWWRHENLHRRALRNFPEFKAKFAGATVALENELLDGEKKLFARGGPAPADLERFSADSFARQDALLAETEMRARTWVPATRPFAPLYRAYRWRLDRAVGLRV